MVKEIKDTQVEKDAIKLFVFENDTVLHIEKPEDITKITIGIKNKVGKIVEHKNTVQKSTAFNIAIAKL